MVQAASTLRILKHQRIWQELDEDARDRLQRRGRRERHPRGSILWGPDDERGEVRLVLEGRVRVCRFDALGRELVVGMLEEGELVTQEEMGTGPSGYVEALEPSEILRVRRVELEHLLDEEAAEIAEALRRARTDDEFRG